MGIGTLIIFIAVILVAAIAAAVLLGTGGKLQQTALKTGEETTAAVATGVEVTSIYAKDGSTGSTLDNFYIMMRLNPGSDPLKMDSTVLQFDTKNTSQELIYNGTVNYYCPTWADSLWVNCTLTSSTDYNTYCSSLNTTANCSGGAISYVNCCLGQLNSTSNSSLFSVEYVKTGPDYQAGYLHNGDFLRLMLDSTRSVGESETIKMRFVPRIGQVTPVQFSVPDVLIDEVVYVYP